MSPYASIFSATRSESERNEALLNPYPSITFSTFESVSYTIITQFSYFPFINWTLYAHHFLMTIIIDLIVCIFVIGSNWMIMKSYSLTEITSVSFRWNAIFHQYSWVPILMEYIESISFVVWYFMNCYIIWIDFLSRLYSRIHYLVLDPVVFFFIFASIFIVPTTLSPNAYPLRIGSSLSFILLFLTFTTHILLLVENVQRFGFDPENQLNIAAFEKSHIIPTFLTSFAGYSQHHLLSRLLLHTRFVTFNKAVRIFRFSTLISFIIKNGFSIICSLIACNTESLIVSALFPINEWKIIINYIAVLIHLGCFCPIIFFEARANAISLIPFRVKISFFVELSIGIIVTMMIMCLSSFSNLILNVLFHLLEILPAALGFLFPGFIIFKCFNNCSFLEKTSAISIVLFGVSIIILSILNWLIWNRQIFILKI